MSVDTGWWILSINLLTGDSDNWDQTVYAVNNGSGCNSVLIELDRYQTQEQVFTVTLRHLFKIQVITLGTITSVVSSSDTVL